MKTIPLTQGHVALVDDADFDRVSQYNWHVIRNKRMLYAVCDSVGRMHRFILGVTDTTVQVDHEDRNGLNNQRHNLRKCVNGENCANKPKAAGKFTSRFKGVSWDRGKWTAQLTVRRRVAYRGRFTDEIEAAKAYDIAARLHFGEFALCNFPQKISCEICAPALDFPVGARIA